MPGKPIQSTHVAVDYLSNFSEYYEKIDTAFWKVIEGGRKPIDLKLRPHVYCCPSHVEDSIAKRNRLWDTISGRLYESVYRQGISNHDQATRQVAEKFNQVILDICSVAAFRSCKYIVRIDPTVERDLVHSEIPKEIPSSVYLNLPSWSFFLEFGKEFRETSPLKDYDGVFVTMLERRDGHPMLHMKAISQFGASPIQAIQGIQDNLDLEAAIKRGAEAAGNSQAERENAEKSAAMNRYVANVCMYLTSKEPDYSAEKRPAFPKRIKSAYGLVCKEAETETLFDLGVRMGAAINAARALQARTEAENTGTGRTVLPHIRKAHWQGFWTGKRDGSIEAGERKLIVKWIPAIPVMFNHPDELLAAIRTVEPVEPDTPDIRKLKP